MPLPIVGRGYVYSFLFLFSGCGKFYPLFLPELVDESRFILGVLTRLIRDQFIEV